MKYTYNYFKKGLPKWKFKKESLICRYTYRPLSFYVSALCANLKIDANTVSYFSCLVAIISCGLFLFDGFGYHLAGALGIHFWYLLDCVDGNLARSVKKQPFGEFADALSSYILVALLCTCMSIAVYQDGGCVIPSKWIWIVLLGAFASTSDTLMRLCYQKYVNEARKLSDQGIIEPEVQKRTLESESDSLIVKIEQLLGIGGDLPIIILLGVIFNFLDVVVLFCFCYYGGSAFVMIITYVSKAIKHTHEWELKQKK